MRASGRRSALGGHNFCASLTQECPTTRFYAVAMAAPANALVRGSTVCPRGLRFPEPRGYSKRGARTGTWTMQSHSPLLFPVSADGAEPFSGWAFRPRCLFFFWGMATARKVSPVRNAQRRGCLRPTCGVGSNSYRRSLRMISCSMAAIRGTGMSPGCSRARTNLCCARPGSRLQQTSQALRRALPPPDARATTPRGKVASGWHGPKRTNMGLKCTFVMHSRTFRS